ncbi:uncharacterized protein LOC144115527 isoform X1 [Amblyomma americanum]
MQSQRPETLYKSSPLLRAPGKGELHPHTGIDSGRGNPGLSFDRGTAAFCSSGQPQTFIEVPRGTPSPRMSSERREPLVRDGHTWRASGRSLRLGPCLPTPSPGVPGCWPPPPTAPGFPEERASCEDLRHRLNNRRARPLDFHCGQGNTGGSPQENRSGSDISQRSFCLRSRELSRDTAPSQNTRRARPAESVGQADNLGRKRARTSARSDFTDGGSCRNVQMSMPNDEAWSVAIAEAVSLWRKQASCKDFSEQEPNETASGKQASGQGVALAAKEKNQQLPSAEADY